VIAQDLDGADNILGSADDETNLIGVDILITPSIGPAFLVTTDAQGDWSAIVPPGATTANVDETDPQFIAVLSTRWRQTEGTDPTTVTAVVNSIVSAGNDGYSLPGAIGNRVWLDENGDGKDDWHFGNDSTFILPDATKVCLDTSQVSPGVYVITGVDILGGRDRYHYGAGDKSGKTVRGEIRATGEASVGVMLRRQGILVQKIKKQEAGGGGKVGEKDGKKTISEPKVEIK